MLSAIGRLGGGWITDYVDNRYVLGGLMVCQAIGVFFLIQVSTYSSPDFWDTVPFAFFHGLAFGGMIPIRGVLVSAYFGRKHFGFISGLTQSGSMIGGLVAPILLGCVFEEYTTYIPALWIITISVCAAIPLSVTLRMPRQKGPWRLLTKCYYHTALAQPSEKMEEVRTIIDHLYYLVFRRLVTALCRVEAVCEHFG